MISTEDSETGFSLSYRNAIPWLCSALFPDPSQVQVLVLYNFLPHTDSFLSSFCYKMHWMCIFVFFWRKINNSHATRTIHIIFTQPSTKFPDEINPLQLNSPNCYTLPYKPNLLFLISDIRALWRSALSARVPECQKLKNRKLGLYGAEQ